MRRLWLVLLVAGCDEGGVDRFSTSTQATTTPVTEPMVELDPDVDSYIPEHFPPANPERVVFLGDSITHGFGLENLDHSYVSLLVDNDEDEWPGHADNDLTSRFGALEVLDVSVDGATTDTLIADQLPVVDTSWGTGVTGETIVVLTIGGNDLRDAVFEGGVLGDAVDSVVANLGVIADFFQDADRFPDGAFIYIASVYEPTDTTGYVPECFYGLNLSIAIPLFDQLGADSRILAKSRGFAMVDMRNHFVGHGFLHNEADGSWYHPDDPTLWFLDDCIHPNIRGHHEIRRLFLAAVDGQPLTLE